MGHTLLELARDIAIHAGESALEARRGGVEVAATKSTATDIVTAVDRDTEALIRSLIADARPGDGVLGEEGDTIDGTSGLNWVVDPIDGTVNFLYGIPSWSISVAVVDGPPVPGEWTALAGVVVNPVTGEVFEASAGGGARGNGRELHVNAGIALDRALVATGFGYSAERRLEQAKTLVDLLPKLRDIRRIGSAALDLCAVASGRLDAFFERGLNPWDHAAGGLIVGEAGGFVGGLPGMPESDRMFVAAGPGLFETLQTAIADAERAAGIE
ncbi:inositol monophosphatase family protein [Agromyces archimandritae]|uniref:Inositol-1-monophosphatase n=1 Tax=Agromyces archimandritae TaxID=2781962 RepID=A0A975IMN6_9MICO|nr:inositol monophosphatase family protein [Agromyces archimandritae]QTX03650.1 inositol monophosphatase [Agromyces archimandritae]